MTRDPVRVFIDANLRFRGRYDGPLRRKIERMAETPLDFLRGSACLFARDVREGRPALDGLISVETPIVGDLHCENFGTFKDRAGEVRYDLDDFDEAARGSPAVDAFRGATSLLLLSSMLGLDLGDAVRVAGAFAWEWAEGLRRRQTVVKIDAGPVRNLLDRVDRVKRTEFIEAVTRFKHGRRTIRRNDHLFDLRPVHRAQARRLLAAYRTGAFFAPEDVCGRMAGCGSLGKLRYAVLVAGDGSRDAKNVVLEFKEALPSSLKPSGTAGRAAGIVDAQRAMQGSSDRFLGTAVDGAQSFVVHEIGPRNDRLKREDLRDLKDLIELAALQGRLLAKGHLRSAPDRSALARGLQGRTVSIAQKIVGLALAGAAQVEEDHRLFVKRRMEVRRALL